MSYQDFLDDKFHKYQHTISGESSCCGKPVIDDLGICSDCYEACDDVSTENEVCGYCGDVEVDEEGQFCSDDCWKGYKWENFERD
tara:strand:- start:317 stop:571 length:255 start_codon:yes stop_codon:yes gene_type:complete